MDLLYVHGGPGLNSEPERRLLSDLLRESGLTSEFWNEPSALRPNGKPFSKHQAYTNWLNALEESIHRAKPKVVVAASFGALGVMDLLNRNPHIDVQELFMLAPTLDLNRVFRTMMEFSANDFAGIDEEKSAALNACLKQTASFWDSAMRSGLALVWQNPKLLTHYFSDTKLLESWAGVLGEPSFGVDMDSQNAVLDELAKRGNLRPFGRKINTPVTVLYGERDPVFDRREVEAIVRERFESFSFVEFKNSLHFPHLEKRSEFVKLIKSKL